MDPLTSAWLDALERRHLAELTRSEVGGALRALSSCYVERRGKLAEGGALSSAGKRAAFALFYGPQHFFVTQHVVRALPPPPDPITDIIDLGCGTGTAGAAWALAVGARAIHGFDRHPWAVAETAWTYRQLQLHGRGVQANIATAEARQLSRILGSARRGTGILAAYAANELQPDGRARLLTSLVEAQTRGARILVIEPIARRLAGLASWWGDWESAFTQAGGRADEWRFPADLPPTVRGLAKGAGLDPRELTARSLYV